MSVPGVNVTISREHPIGFVAPRAWSDPTGIGEYARQLGHALRPAIEDLRIVCPASSQGLSDCSTIPLPEDLTRGYRYQLLAPRRLGPHRFSLLHFVTESELFLWRPGRPKVVVTIHGCASSALPARLHPQLPWRAQVKYRQWLKRVDAIITVSEASKKDIVTFYRVPPDKIAVIYNGIDGRYLRLASNPLRPAQVTGERPFILSVCATIPKKNIEGILKSLAILKQDGLPHRLIHVGPRDWGFDAIDRLVQQLGLQSDVEFKGRIPTDDLVQIYCQSAALVFPSFHEGFGIPILEAMACGCPVITSDCSPMPETAGDAAVFVSPHDSAQIAVAIRQVLDNERLRDQLIEKGRHRAIQFSWDKTADEVMSIYQQLLARGS